MVRNGKEASEIRNVNDKDEMGRMSDLPQWNAMVLEIRRRWQISQIVPKILGAISPIAKFKFRKRF